MAITDFYSRRNRILEYVVTTHIELGIPVGSVTLCNRSKLDLSPATIRNIMRELEGLGYMAQPHTSAGRVPTDAGYRYYVDRIMEPESIPAQERESINFICSSAKGRPEILLEKVLKMLAEITNEASLVLFPRRKKNLLKEIKIFSVEGNRAIAILITTAGLIKSEDFQRANVSDESYLQKISQVINNNCSGKPLSDTKEILSSVILSASDFSYYIAKDALDVMEKIDVSQESDKLFLDGTHYLFEQPEFRDVDKSKRLLKTFEEKDGLMKFIEENLSAGGVRVSIGEENSCEGMQDCSMVMSGYGPGENILGAVGVIGPTRMPYKRVIPVVDYIAGEISCALSHHL